jgi:hypothetical protein
MRRILILINKSDLDAVLPIIIIPNNIVILFLDFFQARQSKYINKT